MEIIGGVWEVGCVEGVGFYGASVVHRAEGTPEMELGKWGETPSRVDEGVDGGGEEFGEGGVGEVGGGAEDGREHLGGLRQLQRARLHPRVELLNVAFLPLFLSIFFFFFLFFFSIFFFILSSAFFTLNFCIFFFLFHLFFPTFFFPVYLITSLKVLDVVTRRTKSFKLHHHWRQNTLRTPFEIQEILWRDERNCEFVGVEDWVQIPS